ncbi:MULTISPECIES: collagen-like protein [Ruminococcus]|uniref:collagen-like protein n=1 Tax=Ruminococcus TaxID=1263 RepID=UPI000E4372FD|nr:MULTISPECIES: collagen-like protein [Ruminococcus]RGM77074.1 collagen-like protein [Ruminococcus sp. OM06-36AC]
MMKFLVKQQKIEALEREVIASDQIAFVSVKFVFDGAWKTLHKVVQFTQCEETYNLVLGIDGTTCLLPSELHPGAVKMSLFGYDAESDTTVRATTVPVTLHIRSSGFVADGDTPIPPTPDLYTQLLKKLSEMQTGANGKDGRSAYEIALENGFVGTVAEWLESLKGRDGIDGKDGADGLPGKDGTNGKDGLPGKDGRDGKDGVSPDLTNYPDTDAVKALIQAAVQPLLQQVHVHKNLNVLDDLTADELSLLRALQEFEDDTTYNIQTFREAIAALNEKAHTHENQSALDQITAAKIAQWDGFGTQINGLSTKVTVYSEKTERTLESLQKQIDNLTSGRNYTVLFQSGQNAISTYASNLSMILDGGYQTMTDFLAAYPQFCSAANDFVLSYSQACFNWDKSVLTVCTKSLSLTKNAEIVMSYQSGSSEAGSLYLVQKPQKIDIPIGVYVNTEIDANRAVSLDFQWLQSDNFITTITECTGISDGEYYLAWVGRSNNSHPKIRFLKVLEG